MRFQRQWNCQELELAIAILLELGWRGMAPLVVACGMEWNGMALDESRGIARNWNWQSQFFWNWNGMALDESRGIGVELWQSLAILNFPIPIPSSVKFGIAGIGGIVAQF